MSTVSTSTLNALAADWKKLFGSAVISGIVGDAVHAREGGYHIGRAFQSSSNYSCTKTIDRKGPSDAAAAIDMSMNTADMKLCSARLLKSGRDKLDPRLNYCNAFNGTINGTDAIRMEFDDGYEGDSTEDHTWHVHLEIHRAYVNDAAAKKAILSVLKGETYAKFMAPTLAAKVVNVVTTGTTKPATPPPVAPAATAPLTEEARLVGELPVLKKGAPASQAYLVRRVQRLLPVFGVHVAVDGTFGVATETGVKGIQKKLGLPVTGVVDKKLWSILVLGKQIF